MAIYEIQQLENHVKRYRVEADSKAEAIVKLFDGEAVFVDCMPELVDLCDDRGLPADDFRELAEELRKLGIMTNEPFIPSIISIEEVSGSLISIEEAGVRFSMPADAQVDIRVHEAE
jgi:hypothetical protein